MLFFRSLLNYKSELSYHQKYCLDSENTIAQPHPHPWLIHPAQREGMDLPRVQAMPSLRVIAHDGVLCTFINRSAPDRDKWYDPSGQAAWTVHHVQNHTLPGHSPPANQASRRVGQAL